MDTMEYLLDNGLKVIAREMHHAPLVAFFVWYRVGGRNEVPGVTGISHWVEHMMFKGTRKYKKGELDRMVSRHGGIWNAFTWIDFTVYFEVLPANYLDLSLDIESDRMINCLFDPVEVDSERTVIISEREGAENSPEFWLDEAVTRRLPGSSIRAGGNRSQERPPVDDPRRPLQPLQEVLLARQRGCRGGRRLFLS
ncbi:MAG: insulinase family protein [Candidatus Fermentithermobacillus carboniphilus]|uniref:Insulinase family protein n=1 Tax=Candidatus Fermentithermobacillus carboniphilus TaxID=3085328 RepID=A0AAT9LBD4_9FIRM|nr:MAG: insulinase family protein [Candidatus Fermentithermobacillus carboniphilus]